MDRQENKAGDALLQDQDRQINLVLSDPGDEEDSIDLGRVFQRMKDTRRLYAWVLLLCMAVGVCAPLLLYQMTEKPLTVSSVVTLTYDLEEGPVADLTAPDGENLDLSMVSSSYVLQSALKGIALSQAITVDQLRKNLSVTRTLTEESVRQQEVLAAMKENKSNGLYEEMANAELNYTNTFVVSLKNGFGDEDARTLIMLQDSELRQLLDRVLTSYNDYMVKTYANLILPDDEVSLIDQEGLDIPEVIIQLQSALRNLYTYCSTQPSSVRAYRSATTGYTLDDLRSNLNVIRQVDAEYLSIYVLTNGIARDRQEVIDNQRYLLQNANVELEEIQENIATTKGLLTSYRNDTILISSSKDGEGSDTAQANTQYYNSLLNTQARNERLLAEKQEEIREIETRISILSSAESSEVTENAEEELQRVFALSENITGQIRDHMQEVMDSTFYTSLTRHSAALGEKKSFLEASMKRVIIGLAVGIVLGVGLWFLAGLLPELMGSERKEDTVPATAEKVKGGKQA